GDVAHGYQDDLALDGEVRIAGVVGEQHAAVAVLPVYRSDDEIIGELDFGRAERGLERRPLCGGEHVAALDRDDVTGGARGAGEEAATVNRARPHLGPGRSICEISHPRPAPPPPVPLPGGEREEEGGGLLEHREVDLLLGDELEQDRDALAGLGDPALDGRDDLAGLGDALAGASERP